MTIINFVAMKTKQVLLYKPISLWRFLLQHCKRQHNAAVIVIFLPQLFEYFRRNRVLVIRKRLDVTALIDRCRRPQQNVRHRSALIGLVNQNDNSSRGSAQLQRLHGSTPTITSIVACTRPPRRD